MDDPAAIDGEEETESRFLLVGNEPLPADAVAAVLAALQPAALVVGAKWERGLIDVTRRLGVALLMEDDVDLAADGVHLTDPGRVAEVRSTLDRNTKDRLILGADVGLSRHDAMVAGEEGADYVAFGTRGDSAPDQVLALVDWWRSTTVLPCLAYAEDVETAVKLAHAGTDFVGISRAIWEHPSGPTAAASSFSAALDKS